MSDITKLFSVLTDQMQKERSNTQMTLGNMIKILEKMPDNEMLANLSGPHSYRGYYSDLAFELDTGTRPASEILEDCRESMGKTFMGYKGGDFTMKEYTPVWVASYGHLGEKLIAFKGTEIETEEDEF